MQALVEEAFQRGDSPHLIIHTVAVIIINIT